MEGNDNAQLEMLSKIHNQLVDLKKVLVEIELARPEITHSKQVRLRQIIGGDQHIDAGGQSSSAEPRTQKVISPSRPDITPGEARD